MAGCHFPHELMNFWERLGFFLKGLHQIHAPLRPPLIESNILAYHMLLEQISLKDTYHHNQFLTKNIYSPKFFLDQNMF